MVQLAATTLSQRGGREGRRHDEMGLWRKGAEEEYDDGQDTGNNAYHTLFYHATPYLIGCDTIYLIGYTFFILKLLSLG